MESNIICLIIFGIMLGHDLLRIDRQEKQIKFDHALAAMMLYFVSDVFCAAVIAGIIPRTLMSVALTNFSNYCLMSMITYFWLRYVMAVEQVPNREKTANRFAGIFPFLVSTAIMIIVFCAAPHHLIDENLEVQPVFNVYLIVVPCINIATILIYTLRKAKHVENPTEKHRHLFIGFFPLMAIGAGLLQVVVLPSTPVFCFGCTILMLVFYIQSMEVQISLDPLTQLNNRGQLVRYISQTGNLARDGGRICVIMLDVNSFKAINDTYGHAEGDRALVVIADSLKKVVSSHSMPVFLARYGGDEFVLIAHPAAGEELHPLIGEIRERIISECRERKTPYLISVGVGVDEVKPGSDSIQKCIQRADEKMYVDKKNCKKNGQQTICV